jgi:hypothetical protein
MVQVCAYLFTEPRQQLAEYRISSHVCVGDQYIQHRTQVGKFLVLPAEFHNIHHDYHLPDYGLEFVINGILKLGNQTCKINDVNQLP